MTKILEYLNHRKAILEQEIEEKYSAYPTTQYAKAEALAEIEEVRKLIYRRLNENESGSI